MCAVDHSLINAAARALRRIQALVNQNSVPQCIGRDLSIKGKRLRNRFSTLLIVDEKEQPILADGASERTSANISVVLSARYTVQIVEEVVRNRTRCAVIPTEVPMKLIRSAFRYQGHLSAADNSVRGIGVRGGHAELLDGVKRHG